MSLNLADLHKFGINKINIDSAAGSVAFKKGYNLLLVAEIVER